MILLNARQCVNCQKYLVSKTVHDFDSCGCEYNSFVDGGREYLRFGGLCRDLSIVIDSMDYIENPELTHFLIRECLFWGRRTNSRGRLLEEVEYIPFKDLSTSHIEAILNTQIHLSEARKEVFRRELEWRK